MKAFKKHIILSFIYILVVQFCAAQSYSINGQSCALPNIPYTYTFSGAYPTNPYQYTYITGGTFVGSTANSVTVMWFGYGDFGPANITCYYGTPVTFNVQVAGSWSNTVTLTGCTFSNNTINSVTANYSGEAGTTCPFSYTWTDAGDGSNFNTVVATSKDLNLTNINKSTVTLRREVRVSGGSSDVWPSNVISVQAKIIGGGQDAGILTPSPGVMCSSAHCRWWESTDMINWTYLNHDGYSSYSPGALTATRYYKADIACGSLTNTAIFKVLVVPPLDGGVIIEPAAVKAGQVPGIIKSQQPANGCSMPAYQWEKSDNGINFTAIPNATAETYAPGVLYAKTWYRRKATCLIGGYSNVVVCNVMALPPGGMASLGKGIDDLPNTSVIPLVTGGPPIEIQYNTSGSQSFYTIKNVLALQVLEETTINIPGDFTASVQLQVEFGHSNNPDGLCKKDVTLNVNYTKGAGSKYDALNYLVLEDAEFIRITVLGMNVPATVNGVAFDTKQVLKLTNAQLGTRYYDLANNQKPYDLTPTIPLADAVHLSWKIPANTNNNGVQLEWAWLEDGMQDNYKNSNGDVDHALFLNAGATRIDLKSNEYDIPMLYEGKGTLCMRVRAVSVMPSGSRSDGPWSEVALYNFNEGHEPNLNWQATTSYAEEGKRKTVVQYFDGTLRSRQTVTKDNTTGQTVVAETIYDMEGRPAVQVLPVPGINNIVAYTKNLNRFSGQLVGLRPGDSDYEKSNPAEYFDFSTHPSVNPGDFYTTTPLDYSADKGTGAAKYYSGQNPDHNTGIHQNIPEANGYPYSVTRYTPDGTGRIMRQSGVGDSHKMGSDHETKYFYGTAEKEVLDPLFGTEIGNYSHYFKNMVQDANGQVSVSYLDMNGRTIATALAGVSDMQNVTGSGFEQDIKRDLLSKESNLLKGNSIESISTILVPVNDTKYKFNYKLNKQTITLPTCNGGTVTYDCVFDLEIAITDESGENPPDIHTKTEIGVTDYTFEKEVRLAIGSYSVRKTLTMNKAWLNDLVEKYSADGVGVCNTLQELITTITDEDELEADCNGQNSELTSDYCISTLGTFEAYKNRYAASISPATITPELLTDIRAQYDAELAFCTSLDPKKSQTLKTIRAQMLADMVPYTGQYADPGRSGAMYNKYNIFSAAGGAFQPFYKNPRYLTKEGDDKYYNDYGAIDPTVNAAMLQDVNMNRDKFYEMFKGSWANSLLPHHPEFGKLRFAEANLAESFNFIDGLQATTTAYDPIPSDDFFKRPEQVVNKSTIETYSTTSWPKAGGYSMWQLAYGDAFGCKTLLNNDQRNTCYDRMPRGFRPIGTVVNNGITDVLLTSGVQSQAWLEYKGFYTQVRSNFVNGYINDAAGGYDNESLTNEGYVLYFPRDLAEAVKNNAAVSNTNEWTALIPDAQEKFPSITYGVAHSDYGHPCDSYINSWRQALLACPQLDNRGDKEEILTSIIAKMQEICRKGTDAANPYGASSVAPAYNNDTYKTFEEVILGVFNDKGIPLSEVCHPYDINWPRPYGMNPRIAQQSISAVEPCTCSQWSKIVQEMAQAEVPTSSLESINVYLMANYKETISAELYAGLLKCNQAFQVCKPSTQPDPDPTCPECRAAIPNPNCTSYSSIPLTSAQPLPSFLVCGFDKSIDKCFSCSEFVQLKNDFKYVFRDLQVEPDFSDDMPDEAAVWNELFAKFVNFKTGLQHNWLYYAGRFKATGCPIGDLGGDAGASSLSICRDDKPLNEVPVGNPPSPCDVVRTRAKLKATLVYQYLQQQAMASLRSAYFEKCASVSESFDVDYKLKEYHYTLYYYDRAGNLVKTVPPKGVQPNYDPAFLAEVKVERENMGKGLPYSEKLVEHTLVTRYLYNSLNKIVLQLTPDAGITQFWYDGLGREAASRNAEQAKAGNVYTYTRYDDFGRVMLTSQITSATTLTDPISKDKGSLTAWYNAAYNSQNQIVQSVYDNEHGLIDGYDFKQNNLRNRISYTNVWNKVSDNFPVYSTYYNYDVHGNVDELLQDFGSPTANTNIMNNNRWKKIVYDYDLISGKVNKVRYQPGMYDSYYHRYEYDGENRLTDVYSGRDEVMLNVFKEREAHYDYYKHGPLASTTLGQLMVQKQDYVYTIQGWLKGVNPAFGGTLANGTNMADANPKVAQDAYGFSLHYFDNDYKAIGYARSNTILGSLGGDAFSLYNGNIAAMAVNIPKLGASKVYNYHYDQLNRLVAMDAYNGLDVVAGAFNKAQSNEYKERVSYDPNGNILRYIRNGIAPRESMDDITYEYEPQKNRLLKVVEQVADADAGEYSKYNDIKKWDPTHKYEYDEIGNLVKDPSEGISDIKWTVYGKIASITKSGVETKYVYDAAGNRVLKINPSGSTAYVRDGSGNVLSAYTGTTSGNVIQSEVHLYGSSRLGVVTTPNGKDVPVDFDCGWNSGINRTFTRGEKLFELSNHLGNVLATVTDKRIAVTQAGSTSIDHYEADVASAQDYYPFGMIMPGRKDKVGSYRYGFNGKENDNDVKGDGNQQDYGMRIYDPRIGKFLSEDPITKKYPELTPYQFASNRPIDGIDEDGLEWAYVDKFNVQLHITDKSTDKEKLLIAGARWVGYDLAWGKPVPKIGTVSKAYTFGARGMTTFGVDAKGEGTKTWQSYASLSTGNASTDRKLGTLHSSIQGPMKSLILKANLRFNIDLRVSDGFRSVRQQDVLYAQGRTQAQVDAEKNRRGITRTILIDPDNEGGIVTNAIGGYSNHNFGLAIDVVPWENNRLNWETRKYPLIGLIGESRGLEWGGRWKSIPDKPHFQNLWGYSLGRLRRASTDSDGLPILDFQEQSQ